VSRELGRAIRIAGVDHDLVDLVAHAEQSLRLVEIHRDPLAIDEIDRVSISSLTRYLVDLARRDMSLDQRDDRLPDCRCEQALVWCELVLNARDHLGARPDL